MARAKTSGNGNTRKKAGCNHACRQIWLKLKKTSPPTDLEVEIRRRAYELYEQRGYTPGHENEDWLVAEQEVLARHDSTSRALRFRIHGPRGDSRPRLSSRAKLDWCLLAAGQRSFAPPDSPE